MTKPRQKQYKLTLDNKIRSILEEMVNEQAFRTMSEAIYHCIRTTNTIYKLEQRQFDKKKIK